MCYRFHRNIRVLLIFDKNMQTRFHVIRYPKDNAGQTLVEIGPMVSEDNILNTVVYHDRC
jgi:hypothetical protein